VLFSLEADHYIQFFDLIDYAVWIIVNEWTTQSITTIIRPTDISIGFLFIKTR